jgi:hypothetical protein
MPTDAVSLLQHCLERLLKSSSFDRNAYRPGRFSGYNEPSLVESLMFVSVESAPGATRYVNGDWSTIGTIMPITDRFVREAGWIATVMGYFITLCERAKASYPASEFADQILSGIGGGSDTLAGWHGTLLPARIAVWFSTSLSVTHRCHLPRLNHYYAFSICLLTWATAEVPPCSLAKASVKYELASSFFLARLSHKSVAER